MRRRGATEFVFTTTNGSPDRPDNTVKHRRVPNSHPTARRHQPAVTQQLRAVHPTPRTRLSADPGNGHSGPRCHRRRCRFTGAEPTVRAVARPLRPAAATVSAVARAVNASARVLSQPFNRDQRWMVLHHPKYPGRQRATWQRPRWGDGSGQQQIWQQLSSPMSSTPTRTT